MGVKHYPPDEDVTPSKKYKYGGNILKGCKWLASDGMTLFHIGRVGVKYCEKLKKPKEVGKYQSVGFVPVERVAPVWNRRNTAKPIKLLGTWVRNDEINPDGMDESVTFLCDGRKFRVALNVYSYLIAATDSKNLRCSPPATSNSEAQSDVAGILFTFRSGKACGCMSARLEVPKKKEVEHGKTTPKTETTSAIKKIPVGKTNHARGKENRPGVRGRNGSGGPVSEHPMRVR